MTKLDAIRAHIKAVRDNGFGGPSEDILAQALDAIEKARAFINVDTVYTGTQDDTARLKAACAALDAFYKPVPDLIQEPAEPAPEAPPPGAPVKRVSLPVIKDNVDAKQS